MMIPTNRQARVSPSLTVGLFNASMIRLGRYLFKENVYFSLIALLQLATHPHYGILPSEWSPTGPFSTFIPLVLCASLEVIVVSLRHIRLWREDRAWNAQRFGEYRNDEIRAGMIVTLTTGQRVDMDVIPVTSSREEEEVRVDMSSWTGECRPVVVRSVVLHDLSSISSISSRLLVMENNLQQLDSFRAVFRREDREDSLDHTHLIVNGSVLLSSPICAWVVACGHQRKGSTDRYESPLHRNELDERVWMWVMRPSMVWMMVMVGISLYHAHHLLGEMIRAVLAVNGIFPMSVQLWLDLVRMVQASEVVQARRGLGRVSARHLDHLPVEEDKEVWWVTDKTGTLTANVLGCTCVWSNPSFPSPPIDTIRESVCQYANGSFETEEDRALFEWCRESLPARRNHQSMIEHIAYDSKEARSGVRYRRPDGSMYTVWKGSLKRMTQMSQCETITIPEGSETMRMLAIAIEDGPQSVHVVAVMGFADPVLPEAVRDVPVLAEKFDGVCILTGDRREVAEAVARQCGFSRILSFSMGNVPRRLETFSCLSSFTKKTCLLGYEMTPEGKRRVVEQLQREGKRVISIGDGRNDEAMIAQADVGVMLTTHHRTSPYDVTLARFSQLLPTVEYLWTCRRANEAVALFTVWKSHLLAVWQWVCLLTQQPLMEWWVVMGFHVIPMTVPMMIRPEWCSGSLRLRPSWMLMSVPLGLWITQGVRTVGGGSVSIFIALLLLFWVVCKPRM